MSVVPSASVVVVGASALSSLLLATPAVAQKRIALTFDDAPRGDVEATNLGAQRAYGVRHADLAIASITPAGMLAEQHRKMAEPGSGS